MSDFFETHTGNAEAFIRRRILQRRLKDAIHDIGLKLGRRLVRLRRQSRTAPRQRVLVVGVEAPSRVDDIHRTIDRLKASSRHELVPSVVPMGPRGKFQNIDAAIAGASQPLESFDWLIVTDDDIAFGERFVDDLIALAEAADLSVAQPAHAFASHTTYSITTRRWGSLVRQTDFVEIGPLTLVRADAFAALIPFPDSRWCYGIDLVWGELARRMSLKMGIVDGTPIRHLRPVAATYDMTEAVEEGRALLRRYDVQRNRADVFELNRIVIPAR